MATRRLFAVQVAAHDVVWLANGRRWPVGPLSGEFASTEGQAGARRDAIKRAHIDAGVPPFRSLLRQSVKHTAAQPVRSIAERRMRGRG